MSEIDPKITLAIKEELERVENRINTKMETAAETARSDVKSTRNLLATAVGGVGLLITVLGWFGLNRVVEDVANRKIEQLLSTNILNAAQVDAQAVSDLRVKAEQTLSNIKGSESTASGIVTDLKALSGYKVVMGRIPLQDAQGKGDHYEFINKNNNTITLTFQPALPRIPVVLVSSGGKDCDNVFNYRVLSQEKVEFVVWDLGTSENKRELKKTGELMFVALY